VSLRAWLKRLERGARGEMGSFELLDGSRYYFDPLSGELFLHWCDCIRAGNPPDWPEPPEVVRKLCEARDVRRALEELTDPGVVGTSGFTCLVYDAETLINERRLEPRSLVAGRDAYDQAVEDLSE
jgi:hypothetical protein